MRFRASLPIAVIVLSILVLAQDVGSPSGAYRRKENASTYHTKGCPFAKSGGWEMVSVTIGEILNGSLQPCSVCHPDKDPAIKGAIDAYRAKKKAEDDAKAAVAAAKATADAAARKSKWPADVSPSKVYRRSTDATTYHTSDCPFAGIKAVIVAVTPTNLAQASLSLLPSAVHWTIRASARFSAKPRTMPVQQPPWPRKPNGTRPQLSSAGVKLNR